MDSSKIKIIIIAVFALFCAIYLGIAAATAQLEAVAWIAGTAGFIFVLAMGRHVWTLIPISMALGGGINAIPGSPRVVWLAMAVTGTMFILRLAMRRQGEFTFRWNWLDFAILLQALAIGQAYLRNPSGISMLGGDAVGGKAYFVYAFAIASYFLLALVPTNLRMIRTVVIAMIVVGLLDGILGLAANYSSHLAALVMPIYSGVSFEGATSGYEADASTDRVTGGKLVGEQAGRAAFTLFPPASTFNPLYPLRFLLMTVAVWSIGISGFRSSMGLLAIFFVVGSLARGRILDLCFAGFVGIIGIAGIMFVGVDKIPYGAQRILSVLPVGIDDRIKQNAEESSEWRFEMWKLALTTDHYIQNKLLGDGFSFRADELAAARDAALGDARRITGMKLEDIMLARGSYHGFHVETIRMTGTVGLAFALIGLGIFFRAAWRHIKYFKGRPEWGYVLFICVPFLIHPFYLMLVFGDYRFGFPEIIIMAGMLKLLDNIRRAEALEQVKHDPAASSVGPPASVQAQGIGRPMRAMRAR